MIWLELAEVAVSLLLAAFVITQIIVPLCKGTRMCPIFSRTAQLEHEVAEARSEQEDAKLEAEASRGWKDANNIRVRTLHDE